MWIKSNEKMDNENLNVISDLQIFNECTDRVNNVLTLASAVSGDVTKMAQIASDLKREIALMDHQLEAFIVDKRCNLEKFKKVVPIIERQLDRVSDRMDIITIQLMNSNFGALDANSIKQRELLINMLIQQSENFNNMIVKLLSI